MAMLDLWHDSEVPLTDELWSFIQVFFPVHCEVDIPDELFLFFSSEFQNKFGAIFPLSLGFFPAEKVYTKLFLLALYTGRLIINPGGNFFHQKCDKILCAFIVKVMQWDYSVTLASIAIIMLDLWYDSEVPMTDALWSFMQVLFLSTVKLIFIMNYFQFFSSEFQKNFGAFLFPLFRFLSRRKTL